jgi:sugar lactone lactonase YvrE
MIHTLPTPANQLGESPFWHPHERCLYWIDIPAQQLLRYDPATQRTRTYALPSEPGACAPILRNGQSTAELIVALRTGIYMLHTVNGMLTQVLDAPYDATTFRFNDGKCDAAGRLWVGAMYEPRDQELGGLWCITYQQGQYIAQQKAQGNVTTNGLAFSPDNRLLYWAHTRAHRVDYFDFDLASANIANRRTFKQFAPAQKEQAYGGRPDGAAMDAQGNAWYAMYEGGTLVCLSPAGVQTHHLALSAQKPTMPCFGGDDLQTLYITTAAGSAPEDGCVLHTRVQTPGLPVHYFKVQEL